MIALLKKKAVGILSCDRYRWEILACLSAGVFLGCITQAVYGGRSEWSGVIEKYCAGFLPAFITVAPVTLGFAATVFLCGTMEYLRLLIYPASAFRGMGLGALVCGALQSGGLRELSFAALLLLPYAAASCVLTVYSGEYALGLKGTFTSENAGLTRNLMLHLLKMMSFYLAVAAIICAVFAVSCVYFGQYLI